MAGRFLAGTNANPTLTLPAAGSVRIPVPADRPAEGSPDDLARLEGQRADLHGAPRDGVGLAYGFGSDEVSTPVRAVARQMTTSARARFLGAGRLRIRS